jgi:hypothetical protein
VSDGVTPSDHAPTPTRTLSYATPSAISPAESPLEAHYRAAVLCGALPLLAGTAALLAFVATRLEAFALLGGLVVVVGVLLFLVGGCDLVAYALGERRRLGGLRGAVRRRVLLAGVLLLSNFPIALLYATIALRLSGGSWM